MAYYKTTYGAQDAPEPHNGVSDVEYLERFPYTLVTHTVLKTETKAKPIVSVCVISTIMINKKQNTDPCIDFYLPFDGRSIACVYFRPQTSARTQPPNEVLSSAAMIVYSVYFGPRIIQILR